MTALFSYEKYQELVSRFADDVPRLLMEHPTTAGLAQEIRELDLAAALDQMFTVAVVGQMRVGKSTLLNAIIGTDLAPTGIAETTATVNCFRHGTGDRLNQFRVFWKDGNIEDVPLENTEKWVGQAENPAKTLRLDFFAESPFLTDVCIVDTPGTRATVDSHSTAVIDYISESLEQETLKEGGKADSIVYVVNPVARESDDELLKLFGEGSRLPGSSPYNSIAVVQKWEHLGPDPLYEAKKKCEMIRRQLSEKVSEVFPTSGLLARCVAKLPLELWSKIVYLVLNSPEDVVNELLDGDDFFIDPIEGAALSELDREHLLQQIPWPALRFAILRVRFDHIQDGEALQQAILDASGVERLKNVLKKRFLSRAALIKSNGLLRKAWEPCSKAILTLRAEKLARDRDIADASIARKTLERNLHLVPELQQVNQYIENSLQAVFADRDQVNKLEHMLSNLRDTMQRWFNVFDDDAKALDMLEDKAMLTIDTGTRWQLKRIFGAGGPYIGDRLGVSGKEITLSEMIDAGDTLLESLRGHQHTILGAPQRLFQIAVDRVEQVMDSLDDKVEK
ncbi:MAG: dynamin family protein [Victivallales bacterium]|nr:dynamin family protein [Victivallales bacterium]